MPRRSALKGVLHNFLETYTSRYSDYKGYWLFGQVVDALDRIEFDLMSQCLKPENELIDFAANLAAAKFADQMRSSRLRMSCVKEARLTIARLPGAAEDQISFHLRPGHRVSFAIRAVSDLDKIYECEKRVFVAPHDPARETQRAMGYWGV